jgi:hypothetical protein
MTDEPKNGRWACRLFAPTSLACCSKARAKVAAKPAGPMAIFRENAIDMHYHLRLNDW